MCSFPRTSQKQPYPSHQYDRMISHGNLRQGTILNPDESKTFECWVDADFAGNWKEDGSCKDPMTAKSRSGLVITYAGCPITWAFRMQTLMSLSMTKAEYVSLSSALREQIPLMELMKEVICKGIDNRLLQQMKAQMGNNHAGQQVNNNNKAKTK